MIFKYTFDNPIVHIYNLFMSQISKDALLCFETSITEVLYESGFYNSKIDLNGTIEDSSILVTIGFTGMVQGYLMVESNLNCAVNFINTLADYVGIELESRDNFTQFHKSSFCEIANQISGRSTIHLSKIGLNSDITPPSIITGSSIYTSVSDFDTTKTFFIEDNFGKIKIFVGINIG